jgi:hypothetical protein
MIEQEMMIMVFSEEKLMMNQMDTSINPMEVVE